MFSTLKFALTFLKYIFFAKHKKGHGIHSPFVFDLITNVFNNKNIDDDLAQILHLHHKYKQSNKPLVFNEMGAGSNTATMAQLKAKKNKIPQIVSTTEGKTIRNSSVTIKYGSLIYRLVKYFKPENILEIGTSVGISTLYIARGAPESNFTTIEGVKEKIQIAKKITQEMNLQNIQFFCNDFDSGIPIILKKIKTLDFCFFDGNHTRKATESYFNMCFEKAHNNSVFIFDDIHWSADMEKAWNTIIKHKKVSLSIDLFRLGIIFFKP
ncbi:MAG TPA: class I SAM-dependent methyltransferase, partial [Bacteroidales bacterium]|nr:class I SAM-dependent methyltransferase [Bacteroidales bacterium]